MKRHFAVVALSAIGLSVFNGDAHSQTRSQAEPVSAWAVAEAPGAFEVHNAYGPLRIAGGKELIAAGDTLITLDEWVLIRLDAGEVHLAPASTMAFVERDGRRAIKLKSGGLKYSVNAPTSFQLADSALVVIGSTSGLQQVATTNSQGALGVDDASYAVRNSAGTAEVRSAAGTVDVAEGEAMAFDSDSHEVVELAQLGKTQSPDPCAGLTGRALEECEDEDRKGSTATSGTSTPSGSSSGGGFSGLSPAARAAIVGGGIVLTAVVINEIDDDDEDLASPR